MNDTNTMKNEFDSFEREIELQYSILEGILSKESKRIFNLDPEFISVSQMLEIKNKFLFVIERLDNLREMHDIFDLLVKHFTDETVGTRKDKSTGTEQ
jgi:hypothetical protein